MAKAQLRFCFELDRVEDIQPWGDPGERKLHWFGLTSGRYWVETPAGEILKYTDEFRNRQGYPYMYVDYQVARLFEDLQDHIPAILEPVPDDLATIAADPVWLSGASDWREEDCGELDAENRWSLYQAALGWWHEREIDTAYLMHGPLFSIWRVRDEVQFRWTTPSNESDGVPVFAVPSGLIQLAADGFEGAVSSFCTALLYEMGRGVDVIARNGWERRDCTVDVDGLVTEQRRREQRLADALHRREHTNWKEIRVQLDRLASRIAECAK